MTDRLLLIDGMNLLFQMFFGMPARIIGKNGKPVQGVLGFVAATLKIMRMVEPTHVIVIFDGEHENARTQIDEAYKANRPDLSEADESENPFAQIDYVYRALDQMGLVHCETQTCEADDMIASYVKAHKGETDIVISSFDSDFFQLIEPGVRVLRYRGNHSTFWDDAYLMEKYGIRGCQYVDHKCLTGDTADNIRGIDGIGPKTATNLICRFGDLDAMLLNLEEIERQRLRDAISSGVERLERNRRLITMDDGVKLPYAYEALRYENTLMTSNEVMKAIGLF
ncbi:MAG: 5'-3' exonuclease [Sphaerochaetaceae bacterium]|nr:5'-3' exonuclease [Sphaerochaetaceae bacterium]